MSIKAFFISLILFIGYIQYSSAQGYLKRNGQEIVNDNGPFLLRSIGSGNWMIQEGYMMQSTEVNVNTHTQFRKKLSSIIGEQKTEEFYTYWLNNQFTKADLDSMKSWGFNAIRPALHYKWFTLPIEEEKRSSNGELENTWLPKGFEILDSIVKWCKANEMYVIFDMHGTPGGQGKDANINDYNPELPSLWESEDNQKKLIALWKEIAKRYKNESWVGGYELINEPNWNVDGTGNQNGCNCSDNKALWDMHLKLIKAIRTIDNNHLIFISGNCWGNNYNGIENHEVTISDNNIALTFHKYWNSNDQGAISSWLEMRAKYNLPIWMSESGENSNQWFSDAINLFESNNIGWSWWPVKKGRLNNIFRVITPQSYIDLLNSWGDGQVPLNSEQTYNAVMDYAKAQKVENCIVGKDVIFAMMHNGKPELTKPFLDHEINTWIQCADFDLGNEGYAYHDVVSQNIHQGEVKWIPWNNGNKYRNDGIDIGQEDETYYVGWTEDGEWLQYTLTIPEDGLYQFKLKSSGNIGELVLKSNDKVISDIIPSGSTNKEVKWEISKTDNIKLSKGTIKLRLFITKGGSNIQSFCISPM
ncbi:cellulase family glycosylhydrolase [Carboxylicivirga caseinilyticus]|uniref:cellulase family glycosylhydrolase n=1 Tax=Carboxylicivirga caseinilyticus TaxID=3417572 RepID=UPI003D3300AC|nr:cellulase family glycosylhydrolase [Marinilabiliaceae bacterium A049]